MGWTAFPDGGGVPSIVPMSEQNETRVGNFRPTHRGIFAPKSQAYKFPRFSSVWVSIAKKKSDIDAMRGIKILKGRNQSRGPIPGGGETHRQTR